MVLIDVPSSATKIDFICLFLSILLLPVLNFSIINLGSGFPEPKGASLLTLL